MRGMEAWRPISGFEDVYAASNLGRIRSTTIRSNGRGGKVLKPSLNRQTGYLQVHLYRLSERYCRRVHRLVCQTFLPNPLGLPEVNHKNGIKTDCFIDNLEWSTHAANMQHAHDAGLKPSGEAISNAKLTWASVAEIRASTGKSQDQLAREFGVSQTLISAVVLGQRWKIPSASTLNVVPTMEAA
jgi:hypothetical protein